MGSPPAIPTERLNPTSLSFVPARVHQEDDPPSLFGSFSWPPREMDEAPDSSQPSTINARSSPQSSSVIRSLSQEDAPEHDRDEGMIVPVGYFADGEETPVLPIFKQMDIGKPSVPILPALSTDSLTNGVNRSDIAGLRYTAAISPSPFQPTSVARSMPSPPLSSIGSDSFRSSYPTDSFEAQLKSSPLIGDLIDRLVRCESSTREVQRELGVMHHKVNLLLDRMFISKDVNEPEFNNPFAHAAGMGMVQTPPQFTGSPATRFSVSHSSTPDPSSQIDDLSQVTARLNSLSESVGQLLALQTQQHHLQTTGGPLQSRHNTGLSSPLEVAPKQVPVLHQMHGQPQLGHGFPPRPDMRGLPRPPPHAPMRTWSTGNLDIPVRGQDNSNHRGDSVFRGGKRGSLAPLTRRESTGPVDSLGENWSGANFSAGGNREPALPTVKWESLPLAPELLHSIAKFGVGPPNKVQQRALPFLLRGSDIIAQAPPTQERIAAYVIPAIHLALNMSPTRPIRGPLVVMISTTVDQATQAQRMIRDLGGPIGIRSALGIGAFGPGVNILQEVRALQQNMPHILCGTPQKLHALFTTPNGITGADVRLLVLDEVDQLIARNLHDFVLNIVKVLPPPRSRAKDIVINSPVLSAQGSTSSSLEVMASVGSPPFGNTGRRFSTALHSPSSSSDSQLPADTIERQTALFSNTVPQDVLNLANTIQLREPVRVLVRRDGNVTHSETGQGTRGLRQFYLYLAFTGGGRKDASLPATLGGAGIIGSGRGTSNPETAQAREWKLEALSDLFDDLEVPQAIVHVGGMTALDSVVYKLANRGLEPVALHSDMNAATKMTALNKFRSSVPGVRQQTTKILVIYDVQVKAPDVFQIPLVINYDLPKAVEEYAHRVAPAISSNYARAGVVVNFVTATGGDVEMLRSIECFYKIKCPEVPMSLRELLL